MSKRGVEFVTSTIVLFVILLITAAIMIVMITRGGGKVNQSFQCLVQGGQCDDACTNTPQLPFDCEQKTKVCCSKKVGP